MSMKANKNLQPVLNWILKTDNCSAKNNDINIPSVDPYKLWYAIAIIIISKFLVYFNRGAVKRAPLKRARSKGRALNKAPIIRANINKCEDEKEHCLNRSWIDERIICLFEPALMK